METLFDKKNAERMGKIILIFGVFAALFMGMKFINEAKRLGGNNVDLSKVSTIDVSGSGYAFAIPNIATESFTIEAQAATVQEAQATIAKKANDVMAFLKSAGIEDKDIQTTNYSAYPNYTSPCYTQICVTREPKLIGHTVSQTVTVKIRDTAEVGKIIDGLGSRGVTGLSGPNFIVDNADEVNAEARAKAIADAEEKAEVLARDLGVRLVRIVRFSENSGGGYPMPMYAEKDMAMGGAANQSSVLPAGENKYTSNVTITYQIR